MEPNLRDRLPLGLPNLLSRRGLAGALGLSALGVSDLAVARKKRKQRKKRCAPCQEPETCPNRVCCECGAQSPAPGCHLIGLADNPSPTEVVAACSEACGGMEHWVSGDTSFTSGGLSVACDATGHCLRVQCPI